MMHKNAQANLTRVRLNVMKHWQDSKSAPPLTKVPDCRGIDFGYHGNSTSPKACLCSTTIGTPPWFLHGWHKTL